MSRSADPRTDAELLTAANTDSRAFRELYDRHAARLHAFFRHRTADGDAALELTAETFAQAWLSRGRFRDRRDGSAAPWLFGIARNVLHRSVRRRRIADEAMQRLGLELGADRAPVVPDPHWVEGIDADIERALAALPREQRRAIDLRITRDLAYQDIATEMGCSPVAARIRVSRGLSTIRARLNGDTR